MHLGVGTATGCLVLMGGWCAVVGVVGLVAWCLKS